METVLLNQEFHNDTPLGVWGDSPSRSGVFIYSILVPGICLSGVVGNSLCVLVLLRSNFKCSFYVYLTGLSIVDLLSCSIIFLSGLARGIFRTREGWVAYDALIGIPMTTFLSCISSWATVFVTLDRLIYLRHPVQRDRPKLCSRKAAFIVFLCAVITSAIYTVPYCFIYELHTDGSIKTTKFYDSKFYTAYNWFDLSVFAILPLAFLSVGNVMLVLSIKKAHKMLKCCELLKGKTRKMKYQLWKLGNVHAKIFLFYLILILHEDQTKVTTTLIAIVFFYMIGEVPTHFTAPKTAATILFSGDDERANESVTLEIMQQVTTLLNAFHLTIKFILYALFCPSFHKALKGMVLAKSIRRRRAEAENSSARVSFLDDSSIRSTAKRFDLKHLEFMNMFVNIKAANELPRLI